MMCVSLKPETRQEARLLMKTCAGLSRAVELRLDRMTEPGLEGLLPFEGLKVIVTNRRREEGGAFTGTEEARTALLAEAVDSGADYVDVEGSTEERRIGMIRERIARRSGRTGLILSYHDFSRTPALEELRRIARKARDRGAEVVKIATLARTTEDNLVLIELLRYGKREGIPMAVHGMGERGRLSRIAAPLFGSLISYVSLPGAGETAPGQLTVDEMKSVAEILRYET